MTTIETMFTEWREIVRFVDTWGFLYDDKDREAKPCVVKPSRPIRTNSALNTASDIGCANVDLPRVGDGTHSTGSRLFTASSTASASTDNGTRWGLPRFIRSAGTFQTFSARSISSHRAPRAAPDRAAVRMMKSRQRADTPGRVARSAMKAGTSRHGIDGWWTVTAFTLGSALAVPFTGFPPPMYSLPFAQSQIVESR